MAVTLAALAAVMILLVLSPMESRIRRMDRTLQRLERKTDLLMAHLGIEEPEPAGIADVDALIRQGKKIEAIKRYRELTGAGLKEAKEAVDQRERPT